MITVTPRVRHRTDRAGDPLDGLVNLFDVGIVLAVGFLLAALASLHLTGALTRNGLHLPADQTLPTSPGSVTRPVPAQSDEVAGTGHRVGYVYQLQDGQLVYVVPKGAASTDVAPSPSGSAAP